MLIYANRNHAIICVNEMGRLAVACYHLPFDSWEGPSFGGSRSSGHAASRGWVSRGVDSFMDRDLLTHSILARL